MIAEASGLHLRKLVPPMQTQHQSLVPKGSVLFLLALVTAFAVESAGCKRRRRNHDPDETQESQHLPVESRQIPSVNQVPALPIPNWTSTAAQLLANQPAVTSLQCPPFSGTDGIVWGTDVFTADSSVCVAALHSGLVTREQGGVVQIAMIAGASRYQGTIRNSVTSRNFGQYQASFSFVPGPRPGLVAVPVAEGTAPEPPNPWVKTATEFRAQVGQAHSQECPPGGTVGRVWGTEIYTDDSSICSAAVHAGRITVAQGGTVEFFTTGPMVTFLASTNNGVTSNAFGSYPGSFVFDRTALDRVPRPPAGFEMMDWTANLTSHRADTQRVRSLWCPPGGTAGSVWGSGPYTDDSSACTAAVHAGLITLEAGGTFRASLLPGRPSYTPSARHGITTNQFGEFAGSFRVRR